MAIEGNSTPPTPATSVDLSGNGFDAARAAFVASQDAARLAATRTVPGSAPSGANVPPVLPTIPATPIGGPDER